MVAVGLKKIGRLWFILVGDKLRRGPNPTGGHGGPGRGLTAVRRGQRGGQSTEATTASRGRFAVAPEVDELDGSVFSGSGGLRW
jgi:hypothetical protein